MEINPTKFVVAGLITSIDFQRCRYMVTKLHNCMPDEYEPPEIRPMFDVEWNDYLLKTCRRYGHGFWTLQNCAVIMNGHLLGNCATLTLHISKKYRFAIYEDWYKLSQQHIVECLIERTEHFRQLVYLTVAVDKRSIGTMLFILYNDLVPRTCENFLNRFVENQDDDFVPIQRIVKKSWIQCGSPYKSTSMACENYVVPHDQRGVLSMCNNGRHRDNTAAFSITLDPCPWMDHNYVAFGQLLQGDDVLKKIEQIPTYYQSPTAAIDIVKIGEFPVPNRLTDELYSRAMIDTYFEPVFIKDDITRYLETCAKDQRDTGEHYHHGFQVDADVSTVRSGYSTFSLNKLLLGNYSLATDQNIGYSPFTHLPDYLMEPVEGEGSCGSPIKDIEEKRRPFFDFPSSSDMTI